MVIEKWKTWETTVSKLVVKAWTDDEFRQSFINEPKEILREAGLVIGDFVKVIIHQGSTSTPIFAGADGGTTYEINLPPKPADLTDEQMSAWSVGAGNIVGSCC